MTSRPGPYPKNPFLHRSGKDVTPAKPLAVWCGFSRQWDLGAVAKDSVQLFLFLQLKLKHHFCQKYLLASPHGPQPGRGGGHSGGTWLCLETFLVVTAAWC